MLYISIFILIIIAIYTYLKVVVKLKIKWKTLLKKSFRPNRGNFGLYTYTGNQGNGKTYSLIEYIYDNDYIYFTNINNIKLIEYLDKNTLTPIKMDVKIEKQGRLSTATGKRKFKKRIGVYYNGFKGLIEIKHLFDSGYFDDIIKDKQVVFMYDELFTELTRNTTLSLEIQDFLCQLRKRKIIFLTTAQVWSEIPLYFRRLCRFQINCTMYPILNFGFLLKEFNDAENMRWDNDLQEHVAPRIDLTLSKTRKSISSAYNTRERINTLKTP